MWLEVQGLPELVLELGAVEENPVLDDLAVLEPDPVDSGVLYALPIDIRRVGDPADEEVLAVVGGLLDAQGQVGHPPEQLLQRADIFVAAPDGLVGARPIADHTLVEVVRWGGEIGLRPEAREGLRGEAVSIALDGGGLPAHSWLLSVGMRLPDQGLTGRDDAQLPRR